MSNSINVTEENFMREVIEASNDKPVLVDFWASWCGPCKSLMPILEKLAAEYDGQFVLAKIEIDEQQTIASQFAIRSVPTVKMVKDGGIVDEFTGVIPEDEIRTFIDKHLASAPSSPLEDAITLYQQGDTEQALETMQQLLLDNPADPMIRIEFANMLMREKRFDDAKDLLNSLAPDDKSIPAAAALFAQLTFIEEVIDAPELDELLNIIETNPSDSQAREQICAHYMLRGDYESGMDQLLEIVRRDRSYKDDIGRTTLLKIFDMLGNTELVSQYRRKLALTLN